MRFLSAYLTTLFIGTASVALNDWFGSGDLRVFAFYSLPFTGLLIVVSSVFRRIFVKSPSLLAALLGIVLGLAVGLAYTFLFALFLGFWFGAMSVPVLQSWSLAAALFICSEYLFHKYGFTRRAFAWVVSSLLASCLLFVLLTLFLGRISGEQRVSVAFFQLVPGDQELSLQNPPSWLDSRDQSLLLNLELSGTLRCVRASHDSSWHLPRSRVFLIIRDNTFEPVRLPLPQRTRIVYLQDGIHFRSLQEDAPTVKEAIELVHRRSGWGYWIESASGSKSGGSLGGLDPE
ncbi:MAG: hypothetical protein ACFCU4_11555 [Puniceicoccaceae bacterium]